MAEVLLEAAPLLGRTQLHKVRPKPVEVLVDFLARDELEHAELVELGRGVVDEISSRHVGCAADLIAHPRVDLVGDHLGRHLKELRCVVGKDHGCDLIGQISLQEHPLLFITWIFGLRGQTGISLKALTSLREAAPRHRPSSNQCEQMLTTPEVILAQFGGCERVARQLLAVSY